MHIGSAADLVRKQLVLSDLDFAFEQDLELEPGPWASGAWILDLGGLLSMYLQGKESAQKKSGHVQSNFRPCSQRP